MISGWSVVTDAQAAGARLIAPLQEAVHQASLAVTGALETVGDIGQLRQDNDALRNELVGAQARIAALRQVETENAALRELLAIRAALPMDLVAARVVAGDPGLVSWEFGIAAGTQDGVRVGMPVVASAHGPAALVGTVVSADRQRARIRLFVDPRARIVGTDLETGALGLVAGQPGGQLVMTDVELTDPVAVGDTIVSAGQVLDSAASAYPRGVLIGTVTAVEPDSNGLTQTIFVRPAVDPRQISWVLVVTGFAVD